MQSPVKGRRLAVIASLFLVARNARHLVQACFDVGVLLVKRESSVIMGVLEYLFCCTDPPCLLPFLLLLACARELLA